MGTIVFNGSRELFSRRPIHIESSGDRANASVII